MTRSTLRAGLLSFFGPFRDHKSRAVSNYTRVVPCSCDVFWKHRSVSDLAVDQGVGPVHDLDALAMRGATEEELDAFLAALTSERDA